jgi:hypothetical protein
MRPTKTFEKLLSDPSVDGRALTYLQEYECEICGAEPLEDRVEFICSVAHPEHEGWGEYWRYRYSVCLDCLKVGIASFPDRLRKHAETLEERARDLRQLANAEFSGPTYAEVCAQQRADEDVPVCAQEGEDDEIPY